MNINNRQKIIDKPLKKASNSFYILILCAIAVTVGIQFGNLWYRLDINIIDNVDTQNFKNIVNMSFPIIETVYNSGKTRVSFAGEVKGLLKVVFGFDLDSPATILNAQSPVFMKYYMMQNIAKQGAADQEQTGQKDLADNGSKTGQQDSTGNQAGQGQGTANSDEGKAPGTGQPGEAGNEAGNAGEGAGSGNTGANPGNGDGSLYPDDGSPESSISIGTGYETDQSGGLSGNPEQGLLQSTSSISWEIEDDDETDKTETVEQEKIAIKNNTKFKIDVAKLLKEPLKLDMSKKGPKVLIYHTHTSESYVLKESDLGKKDVPSFNSNPKYSVVRVGEELAKHLKKYGIETLHNGTVHDKVRDAAYGVAIDTLESYKKSYPSIQVYIDIHRDAVSSDKPKLRMTKEINGKNCAQIMFVVGADGTLPHPQWQENLKFVLKLQQKLNEKYPGLAKPILIVGKRYNQHISNQAILVEVGGDGNLLSECIETTKYLAEVLNDVLNEN